tara:strand:- start:1671 stop:2072 length:402 start_codon:yes stop_codon:yes gene_type:complete
MILRILKTMAGALGYQLVRTDYQITAHVTISHEDDKTTVDIEVNGPAPLPDPKITFNPPPENLKFIHLSGNNLFVETPAPAEPPATPTASHPGEAARAPRSDNGRRRACAAPSGASGEAAPGVKTQNAVRTKQ